MLMRSQEQRDFDSICLYCCSRAVTTVITTTSSNPSAEEVYGSNLADLTDLSE
jgi:hypothetical protein